MSQATKTGRGALIVDHGVSPARKGAARGNGGNTNAGRSGSGNGKNDRNGNKKEGRKGIDDATSGGAKGDLGLSVSDRVNEETVKGPGQFEIYEGASSGLEVKSTSSEDKFTNSNNGGGIRYDG